MHQKNNKIPKKIKCPCCGYYTHEDNGFYDYRFGICDVCYWQYDEVSHDMPQKISGTNHISLTKARENYKKFGASEIRMLKYVRKPLPNELNNNMDSSEI